MSDAEWDEEEAPPPPCPIRAGPGSITWSRSLPAELEEISGILGPMEDPVNWFGLGAEKLHRLAWVAVTAFNGDCGGRLPEIAGPIYMAYRDLVPPEHRAFFIDEVARAVADGSCRPDSLGLLVWVEDEPLLIARAAAAYTDARGIAEGDPVSAADELLASWRSDNSEHRAGIFLGLLLVGWAEILDELLEYRYELTDDEVSMICDATISGAYTTTAEFTLGWLEDVQSEGEHGKFAMLASAITPTGPEERDQEGELEAANWRRLTPPGSDHEIRDDWYFPIDRRAMGRHIGPRLRALARREAETRVMPAVLEAYGLDAEGEAS